MAQPSRLVVLRPLPHLRSSAASVVELNPPPADSTPPPLRLLAAVRLSTHDGRCLILSHLFPRGSHDTAPPTHDAGPPAPRVFRPHRRGLRARRRPAGHVLSYGARPAARRLRAHDTRSRSTPRRACALRCPTPPRPPPTPRTSRAIDDRAPHPHDTSPIDCVPCARIRRRPTRRRSAALHPASREARSPRHTPPTTQANHRAHRHIRTAVVVASPPERRATGSFQPVKPAPRD